MPWGLAQSTGKAAVKQSHGMWVQGRGSGLAGVIGGESHMFCPNDCNHDWAPDPPGPTTVHFKTKNLKQTPDGASMLAIRMDSATPHLCGSAHSCDGPSAGRTSVLESVSDHRGGGVAPQEAGSCRVFGGGGQALDHGSLIFVEERGALWRALVAAEDFVPDVERLDGEGAGVQVEVRNTALAVVAVGCLLRWR